MLAAFAAAAVIWAVPPPPNPMPVIHYEPCPSLANASCFIATPRGDAYISTSIAPIFREQVREHELGHAYDAHQLVDGERYRIRKVMGWPKWRPEAFAEFYMGCRLMLDPVVVARWQDGVYGRWHDPRRVAARCRLIARAGL